MKKIKLECWWTDSPSLHNRFIKQFSVDLEKYNFVNSKPDYTIIFGRTEWEKIETPKERTFFFSQEPLWSPNEPKKGIEDYCSKIFVSNKSEYPNSKEYIETLLPMFYAGRGESDYREEWDWSHTIRNKKFIKEKPLSIIVRKDSATHFNHLTNPETNIMNYVQRTNLGIELSKNEQIDVFGTYWENNGKNIKGEVWNKHVGLDEYYFSIGMENTIQKNYISEKFWDIILTDGIPIYLGCSNISEYISDECYINLNDMSFEKMIKKVEEVLVNYEEIYTQRIEYVLNLKQDFFLNSSYNLWEKIKKEIE